MFIDPPPYLLSVLGIMGAWLLFSIYYIGRMWMINDEKEYNQYLYDSIPSVFTTLGVLGTFLGIFFGLQDFDTQDIGSSIPPLLEGLKTAFSTSILGITLSLVAGKFADYGQHEFNKKLAPKPTTESRELHRIANLLEENQREMRSSFQQLTNAMIGNSNDSLSTHLIKLQNSLDEQGMDVRKISEVNERGLKGLREELNEIKNTESARSNYLSDIYNAIGVENDTSLLFQIQKLRAEQNEFSKSNHKNIKSIEEKMVTNSNLMQNKFDEFSELLRRSNTEALVEVMRQVTVDFNNQMGELIDRLVQENFRELNNSVQQLNTWQQENKRMVEELTNKFNQVTNNIESTSVSIKEISNNTKSLTDDNSNLSKLIKELQKVMIEDTKYQEIVQKLISTIETQKSTTEAFDKSTIQLNEWIRKQRQFSDSVSKLLSRLEEIDKIKDINEVFWKETERKLQEGVGIISKANQDLSKDIESINAEFYERLSSTLTSLDELIRRIIKEYDYSL